MECLDFGDFGQLCLACDFFSGYDRRLGEERYHAYCPEMHLTHCWTEEMRNNSQQVFTMGDECVDFCDEEMFLTITRGTMECGCPVGAESIFSDNCTDGTDHCFTHCECPEGSSR